MQELRAAQRLDAALNIAYRRLARRERTTAEIERLLTERDTDAVTIAAAVAELTALGCLDDAGYARRFAADRRRLDGWGSERIERRLHELGVAPELIAVALVPDAAEPTEADAAIALLHRRFPAGLATVRERRRALDLLVRRGYGRELAYDAVRGFGAGG